MYFFRSIAVLSGKLAAKLSRLTGGRGSSLPGVVARRIYSRVLQELACQIKKEIIMVIGTNGKTTTNNMIAKIMQAGGHKVVFNEEGANLITGVTACLVRSASYTGVVESDYALLEVDEASFPKVIQEVQPQIVVITNFFRDQLDRYGELDKTVALIKNALHKLNDITLVLNADDPLVAQLGQSTKHKVIYYGVARQQNWERPAIQTRESRFCPFCGGELHYHYYHYSQLGDYNCLQCAFTRPELNLEAINIKTVNGYINADICYQENCYHLSLRAAGFYNLYNALAAFTIGCLMEMNDAIIKKGLDRYTPAIGRMEHFRYQDKLVLLNLVKNPTGYNEGLVTLLAMPGTKDVFMAVNDNDADGQDISWLWDVEFEILASLPEEAIKSFTCSGTRAAEIALRLKYAGIPINKITVIPDLEQAVPAVLHGKAKMTYFFTTYTALWSAQRILCELAKKEQFDADSMPSVS